MNFKYLDSLVDAAFVIDENFGLIYGNPAFAQLCGVSARRLNKGGKPLTSVIEIKDPLFGSADELGGISEQSMYKEVEFSTESGSAGWCQFTAQKLEEGGERSLWLVYMRDVTLEKALHDKYRAQLEAKEEVIEKLREAQRELKEYSENLEEMVTARTHELSEALALQTATLDSLGQGFFIFDETGACAPYYSKVCPEMFGVTPEGKSVTEVLRLEGETAENFRKWMTTSFMGALDFEDMLGLLPFQEIQVEDRVLELNFYPMEDAQRSLKGIVTVATDVTAQRAAEKELEREKKFAQMIHTILRHQQQFASFTRDASAILERLKQEYPQLLEENREEFFRALHTLKGGAATFMMEELASVIGDAEARFQVLSAQGNGESERAEAKAILLNCAQLFQSTLESIGALLNLNFMAGSRFVDIPVDTLHIWYRRIQAGESLDAVACEMREKYFLEEASRVFGHLESESQRLARLLGKKVAPLRITPAHFRLLPEAYESLIATLVHFLRNALDHGIEDPERRKELGKPEMGQIEIHLQKIANGPQMRLALKMSDDGAGIAVEALRKKLQCRPGQLTVAQAMDPAEILQSVFDDGVTTRETVTSVSGMGVGMSAIRSEARKIGGEAWIESNPGQGTCLCIEVPWIEDLPAAPFSKVTAKSA